MTPLIESQPAGDRTAPSGSTNGLQIQRNAHDDRFEAPPANRLPAEATHKPSTPTQ